MSSFRNQNWKTVMVKIEKINELLTQIFEQLHGINQPNMCISEISLCKNRGSLKEHKQKFKTWMRNQTEIRKHRQEEEIGKNV